MKLTCTKDNLSQALSLVGGIAGKNINLPILANVLIKAENQTAEIVATNLELAVVAHLPAKVDVPGSFTVPARTLGDYINLLSGDKVEMEVVNNELSVMSNRSATKIKGTSAEDFPVIPSAQDGKGYLVGAEELKTGLSQVLSSLAKNDIRPELSGVYFGFNTNEEKGLTMAATDSYRLAEKKIKLLQGDEEFKTIVPGRTASELHRVISLVMSDPEKNVRVLVNDNQLVVHYNGVQMVSRLVDGSYPDYRQIIPKQFNTTAEVNISELVKEIKAASLFTTTGVNAVAMKFETTGKIVISSTSTQTGEYHSELNTDVQGEENNIWLNHRYLLDGLANMKGDRATIKVINADNPCLLVPDHDDNLLYIIMPIRQ